MPGGTEVDKNGATGISKHNVRGLDVPMNNSSQPKCRNCSRDIASYREHFSVQQPSPDSQPVAQRLSFDEFPRDVARVSTGQVTIAMFNQPRQVWMRDVLDRGDLALYANLLIGMAVQFQSYNVISRCAVQPTSSGCPKNYSLTTNGNFGADDVPVTQSSFYFCRHKRMVSHTIHEVSGSLLTFPFQRMRESGS